MVVLMGGPGVVVARPADDYVADFVRDIPKSHVLTLHWVMRPATADDPVDGPVFRSDAVIRTALHAAAATEKPIRVVDDGQLLGVVDRAAILESVAGADPAEAQLDRPGAGPERRPSSSSQVGDGVNDPTDATASYLADTAVNPGPSDRDR
jgi:glycine betaine/proline transport system ATP-binding protein